MNEIASAADALAGQAETAPAEAEQTGNAAWYGEVDSGLDGYIQNKGWTSAKDMAQGYQNLEKLFGADRAGNTVLLPKEGDEEGWNDLYGRLGRPGEASQYKLEAAKDADAQALEWWQNTAFAQGLSNTQANALFESFNERVESLQSAQGEQSEAQIQEDITSLKSQWGQAYDSNIQAGRNAAQRFGFSEEDLGAMESAIGTKGLLEKMASIGKAMGEDSFESGDGKANPGFGITPAQAQAQITELRSSAEWVKQYTDPSSVGHKEAKDKMTRLMQAAYPGGQ